jgi:hypothetical protein
VRPYLRKPSLPKPERGKLRFLVPAITAFSISAAALLAVLWLNRDLLPDKWNPSAELVLTPDMTFVQQWKLRRAFESPQMCRATLARSGASIQPLPDRSFNSGCHIRGGGRLISLSNSALRPLETRCEIAMRLYLWEANVLEPAARKHLGSGIDQLLHFDSYSCRAMRTSRGISARMSEHATANAVDISGIRLKDGRTLTLKNSWNGTDAERAFWREVRDGACDWFGMVLSPDYNALHHDHFHLDQGRWRGCN